MNTIEDMQAAIDHNTARRLYRDSPDYIRVYFTYRGGPYNGQRGSVVSLPNMVQLRAELAKGLYTIDDIELITTHDAWRDWLPKEAN